MAHLGEVMNNVAGQIQRDLESKGINGRELVQLMYTGLFEEVGEVAGIFKRRVRQEARDVEPASDEHLIEELGDVLWYYAGLCYALDFDMEDIWFKNIKKLEERYGRDH